MITTYLKKSFKMQTALALRCLLVRTLGSKTYVVEKVVNMTVSKIWLILFCTILDYKNHLLKGDAPLFWNINYLDVSDFYHKCNIHCKKFK